MGLPISPFALLTLSMFDTTSAPSGKSISVNVALTSHSPRKLSGNVKSAGPPPPKLSQASLIKPDSIASALFVVSLLPKTLATTSAAEDDAIKMSLLFLCKLFVPSVASLCAFTVVSFPTFSSSLLLSSSYPSSRDCLNE